MVRTRDLILKCNAKVGNKTTNISLLKTFQFKTWCKGDKSNIANRTNHFARTLDRTHCLSLHTGWHVTLSHVSAEAWLTSWPIAQPRVGSLN